MYLGIDLGTTAVKAAVLNGAGQPVAQFAQGHATQRPQSGWAEQDPAEWMRLIGLALHGFAGLGRVGFGCLSSQVNTHVFVDRHGAALAPAILWQDRRAVAEAAELDAQLSVAAKIALLGAPIPIDASHPLARMLWMARHRPEVWAATAHVLLPKDYALLHLTGRAVTDPLANVGLVGPDLRWVGAILDLVPGAAGRMVPLAGLTEVVGRIGPGFGLAGVQMVNGTMDGWMGLYGAGAARDGETVYISGTSEVLGVSSQVVTGEPGVVVFPGVAGVRLHAGPTQSGGASQMWFCGVAGLTVEALTALVAGPRGPTPLFLPQLAGERAPLWNPHLRGAFLGLEAGMGVADMGRAVLEGVALSARHVLGALQASSGVVGDTLRCGGGGFRSAPWGQIRADVLGKRLLRLAVNEPVVVGAAALAACGAGDHGGLAEAQAAFASYDHEWQPDAGKRGLYDDLFGIYCDAIAANEGLARRLGRI